MSVGEIELNWFHAFVGFMLIFIVIVYPAVSAFVGMASQSEGEKLGVLITSDGQVINTLYMMPSIVNETMIKTVRFSNPRSLEYIVTIVVNPYPSFLKYEYTVTEESFVLAGHSYRDVTFTTMLPVEPVIRKTSDLYFRLLVEESQ